MIGEEDGVGLTVTDQLLADRAVVGQLQLVIVAAVLHPNIQIHKFLTEKSGTDMFRQIAANERAGENSGKVKKFT
jgi:hypothetical protein